VAPFESFRALPLSLRLAFALGALAACLATYYLLLPGASARYVVPAFFGIHVLVSLWAAQQEFAASKDLSGCWTGVALWMWLALEGAVLGGIWATAVGGPH
jgi:hypothetical protein